MRVLAGPDVDSGPVAEPQPRFGFDGSRIKLSVELEVTTDDGGDGRGEGGRPRSAPPSGGRRE